MKTIFLLSFISLSLFANPSEDSHTRAEELRKFLKEEKRSSITRQLQKKDTLEALDELNAEQNQIRSNLSEIAFQYQELAMSRDNLALELDKQKTLEKNQRDRMTALLKFAYKVNKEGVFPFLVRGQNLSKFVGRTRVLYKTLRSHSVMAEELRDRTVRLTETETRLNQAKTQVEAYEKELKSQNELLVDLLKKKHVILASFKQKDEEYQSALDEYQVISKEIAGLFEEFEGRRDGEKLMLPKRGSLLFPIDEGKITKAFGKSVHETFHTVTLQKGIEIQAEHKAAVKAVLDGVIEFEGWVKGLGNVMIVNHGGGFYSLVAHLYKTLIQKGTYVKKGDTIAQVGDTGNNERPSLYFEIRESGRAVNPLSYFHSKSIQQFYTDALRNVRG